MSILMELPPKLVYNGAIQKRARILLNPNASVECLAIFFVEFWKRDLAEQYRNTGGDVAGKMVVRGDTGQAAAEISGDVMSLLKFFSTGSTIPKSEFYLLLLALLYPAADQMKHPCAFNVHRRIHTVFFTRRL